MSNTSQAEEQGCGMRSRSAAMEGAVTQSDWDEYNLAFMTDHEDTISAHDWETAYAQDAELSQVKTYVTQGWPEKRHTRDNLRKYWEVRDELSISDNTIFLLRGDRVVPPKGLVDRILHIAHEGHLGIVKAKRRMKLSYWWPAMDNQVERFVRACEHCANADKTITTLRPPIGVFQTPNNPWEELSVDIVDPILDSWGTPKYLIVLVDRYSKWPEVEISATVDSDAVITFLTNVFLREGIPKIITSDNWPQFTLEKWTAFITRNGIQA